ncbi:hypothetical protein O181_035308, partial [Austropuccinia psidii MF-1]|nr:hypothetical protein [Austropuccinia psidii MF-1]
QSTIIEVVGSQNIASANCSLSWENCLKKACCIACEADRSNDLSACSARYNLPRSLETLRIPALRIRLPVSN